MPLFPCRKCNTRIEDEALKVFGLYYHKKCFSCFDCGITLDDQYYEIDKLPYCELDFKRPRPGDARSPIVMNFTKKNSNNENNSNNFVAELTDKLSLSQEFVDNKKNHDNNFLSKANSNNNLNLSSITIMSTDNNNLSNSKSSSSSSSSSSNNVSPINVNKNDYQSSSDGGSGSNSGKQSYTVTHIPSDYHNKQSLYDKSPSTIDTNPLVSVSYNNRVTTAPNHEDHVITQTTTTITSNGQCNKCKNEIYGSCIVSHSKERYHNTCFSCTLCLGPLLEGYFTDSRNGNNYCAKCQILLNERNKKTRENLGHCSVCYKRFTAGEFHVVFGQEKFHEACMRCSVCKNQIKDNKFTREMVTSTISNFCCNTCLDSGRVDRCGVCNGAIIGGSSLFAIGKNFHPACFKCTTCNIQIKVGSKFAIDSNQKPRCDHCSEPTKQPPSKIIVSA